MSVEGSGVTLGLDNGLAPALYEHIMRTENADGTCTVHVDGLQTGPNGMMETPIWETARTDDPSPHHPVGSRVKSSSLPTGRKKRAGPPWRQRGRVRRSGDVARLS